MSRGRLLVLGSGLLVATAVGGVLATQPLLSAVVVIGVVVLGLLSLVTPLPALMAVLVLSPLQALITTEVVSNTLFDVGQLTLLLLAASWVVRQVVTSKWILTVSWTCLYMPLVLFIIAVSLTVFRAASLSVWVDEWLKWVLILLLVVLVLNVGRGCHWEWLVFGLVLAGGVNAVVGVYIFFGGSGAEHLLVNDRFFRAFGTFGQPNPFGGFMGLLAPVALAATYGYGVRYWERRELSGYSGISKLLLPVVFYGVSALLIVAGIGVSWSRGAWLGFVVSLLVLLLVFPRRLRVGVFQVGCVGLAVAVMWLLGFVPEVIAERVLGGVGDIFALVEARGVDVTVDNFAVVERVAHWQAALEIAREDLWLGVGLGNYEVVYGDYRLLGWVEPLGHAHNYYLNILAETGIVGFVIYVFLLGMLGGLAWRVRCHPDGIARSVGVGLLGMWGYLVVHSLVDSLYVNNLFIHLGVMFGIVALLDAQVSVWWEDSAR